MAWLTFPSFCKFNPLLKVLGRREDGYHEVVTVLQSIDPSDSLSFRLLPIPEIRLELRGRAVAAGRDNLVHRAARILADAADVRKGAWIRLDKRVPAGAGLGGGSGNAAVTLLALNRLWDCGLSLDQLSPLAARLGSDVPFFLRGGTALASGRGERVKSLPDARPPESWQLLIVFPGIEIRTPSAYRLGGWPPLGGDAPLLTKDRVETIIHRFCESEGCEEGFWGGLENDFEAPLFRRFPFLSQVSDQLIRVGCKKALLCGSGSAVAGFLRSDRAGKALERLRSQEIGEVFPARFLNRERYWAALEAPAATQD